MHELIHNFSLPFYIPIGFGVFLVLLIGHKGVRAEFDAFLAHCFGLKEKDKRKEK
jgi:hypothetical protein